MTIRENFTLENMRSFIDNAMKADEMATMGFATGTLAGLAW